jgi:hypothetical protein
MKVTPVASQSQIQQTTSNETSMKARAIAAFKQADAPTQERVTQPQHAQERVRSGQDTPPVDANNVSAEELSAIQPPAQERTEPTATEESDKTTSTEAKEETQPQDPALSRQFAQLARQERQIRAKAQQQANEFKAQQQAFQAEKQAWEAKQRSYETDYISRQSLKADPLTAMDQAGVTYDEVTQQAITRQPTDPRVSSTIAKLEAKIKSLEEGLENNQKSYAQQQQDSYNAAVKQIDQDVKNLVKSDPEFETIKFHKNEKAVTKLITETYAKDGVLLDVAEAATLVENELVERALNSATKVEKIRKRLSQSSATTKGATQQTQANKQQQTMRTLTNATSSTRQLSARERAVLAFKGELKS